MFSQRFVINCLLVANIIKMRTVIYFTISSPPPSPHSRTWTTLHAQHTRLAAEQKKVCCWWLRLHDIFLRLLPFMALSAAPTASDNVGEKVRYLWVELFVMRGTFCALPWLSWPVNEAGQSIWAQEQNRLNIKKSRVAENRNYNIRHPWCHHPRSRSKPHSSTPLTSAVTVNICIFLHYKVNSSVYVYFFCFITAWKLRFHAKLDDKTTKFRWTRSNVNSEWNIKIFARNDDIAKYNWWSDEHIHVHVLKREHPQIWKQWNEQTIATVRRERGRYFWSLTGTGACARALASLPFSYRIQSDKNIRKRKQGSSPFAWSALNELGLGRIRILSQTSC